MLCGEFRHGVDTKNRVFVPAKFREELGESFVVVKNIREKCLKIYATAAWEAYIEPLKHQDRTLSERVFRFLHSSMAQVSPDSQGRILLPKDLTDYAGIAKDVVIVGCGGNAEIWSPDVYENFKEETSAEEMFGDLKKIGL